jgi:hypothetical protein
VSLSSNWTRSGVGLTNNILIEQHPVRLDTNLYKTSLVVPFLDAGGGDDGNYTCSVNFISLSTSVMGALVPAIHVKNVFVESMKDSIILLYSMCSKHHGVL